MELHSALPTGRNTGNGSASFALDLASVNWKLKVVVTSPRVATEKLIGVANWKIRANGAACGGPAHTFCTCLRCDILLRNAGGPGNRTIFVDDNGAKPLHSAEPQENVEPWF